MRCPACRQTINEAEATCRQCGFSLDALAAHMGIPLQLTPPVADLAGLLSSPEKRTLNEIVQSFEQRFPQVAVCIIVAEIPAQISAELFSFWLFNRASLFSAVEQGGDNHGILLLLDAAAPRAIVTVGYGLEPLVAETVLEICLKAASSHLSKNKWVAGAEAFFRELERQFITLSKSWPQIFGYTDSDPWFESGTGEVMHSALVQSTDPY